MRSIFKNTLLQLLLVYSILACLVYFGFLSHFVLHFQLFSVILGFLAYYSLQKEDGRQIPSIAFLVIAMLFIIFVRYIPYSSSPVPLGYDPGMYKYIFEAYASGGEVDRWIVDGHPPVLSFMMSALLRLGVSSWFILVPIFIILTALLCLLVYLCVKEYFGRGSAAFAAVLFAVSYTQYLAFWFNYYKNILGLCFMLLALIFYKMRFKNKYHGYSLFVFFGALLGGTHLPTFLVFILTMAVYGVARLIAKRDHIEFLRDALLGLILCSLSLLFYIGHLKESLMPGVAGVATATIGAGTFIGLETFKLYSLAYLPLCFIGIAYCLRYKVWNPLAAFLLVCLPIVFFKLFFFNRYIIQLDIAIIMMAGVGIYWLTTLRSAFITFTVLLLVGSGGYFVASEAFKTTALITENEYNLISMLDLYTPSDATILSTHKYYSMWLVGYSGRKVVAPGLFDEPMNLSDYETFVYGNISSVDSMLGSYPSPLYIYFGENRQFDLARFRSDSCYEEVIPDRFFKFVC